MEVLMLDTAFSSIGIVDTFKSLIWVDRFYEYGDFELYLPMSNTLNDLIQRDFYVWNEDSEHVMIVDHIEINSDVEDGVYVTVTGKSLEYILDRRIIWEPFVFNGNFQDAIQKLLNDTIINPSNADRKIPNFIFESNDDPKIAAITIEAQFERGDSVYEVIAKLCSDNKVGFKVTLNESNQFVFRLYTGLDRSYDQSDNPYVTFSPKFDNILNSSYLESSEKYKNVALVGGEGEGAEQKTTVVGSASGLERRELYVSASISSNVDGAEMSDAEYYNQLAQKGNEGLSEATEEKIFEGEADVYQMYRYGEDFTIGDIVQSEDEYGHETTSQITEFIMSQDESGISYYPTFKNMNKEEDK